MSKAFLPGTVVPGAKLRVDPTTNEPLRDKRGRPLWDMPAPSGYAQHNRLRRKKNGDFYTEKVPVPIYRGVSALLAREIRADIRRDIRLYAEARAAAVAEYRELFPGREVADA